MIAIGVSDKTRKIEGVDQHTEKLKISKLLGLHPSAVSRNIEAMRGKYLRRVGPDKGGFWEIIK